MALSIMRHPHRKFARGSPGPKQASVSSIFFAAATYTEHRNTSLSGKNKSKSQRRAPMGYMIACYLVACLGSQNSNGNFAFFMKSLQVQHSQSSAAFTEGNYSSPRPGKRPPGKVLRSTCS